MREAVYWVFSLGFLIGAIDQGREIGGGWTMVVAHAVAGAPVTYPYQGLAVALGILSATFAILADRAHRRTPPPGSA